MDFASGVTGLIVGALLGGGVGLFFAVAFEDSLKETWRRTFRRRRLNAVEPLLRAPRDTFVLGPLKTNCVIVEGDGENPIAEEAINVIVDHTMVRLPDEMEQWREAVAQRRDAERADGSSAHWNGPRYAVAGFSVSREPLQEHPEICLRLQYSDYWTFLTAQLLDRPFSDGSTPRSRYVAPFDLDAVPAFMANSFGTYMAVVTSDGRLLVSRRSMKVNSHPGVWSASANEGLSRSIDSKGREVPNLYDVARRGLREELALDRGEYDLDMLAFAVDTGRHQWAGLFLARLTTVTQVELEERWRRGVADKWEHMDHRFVPFNPAAVIAFLLDPERVDSWAPSAPPLYFLALVNEFGRGRVERTQAVVAAKIARDNR